jgi:hypothetical protein
MTSVEATAAGTEPPFPGSVFSSVNVPVLSELAFCESVSESSDSGSGAVGVGDGGPEVDSGVGEIP